MNPSLQALKASFYSPWRVRAPLARLALEQAMGSQLEGFAGKPGSAQFDKLVLGR